MWKKVKRIMLEYSWLNKMLQKLGSINPRVILTRGFINFMSFLEGVQS